MVAIVDLPLLLTHGDSTQIASHSQSTLQMIRNDRKERLHAADAQTTTTLAKRSERQIPKPKWHAPWKLMRVISGHMGWVRSVSVDVSNEWFATGAGDRVIKVFSPLPLF